MEETLLLTPLRVDSAQPPASIPSPPNTPYDETTQFFVKVAFAACDFRVSPIPFAGQQFPTQTLVLGYALTGGVSDGVNSPRLNVQLYSDALTGADSRSWVGAVTRTDVRTGVAGRGVVQLSFALASYVLAPCVVCVCLLLYSRLAVRTLLHVVSFVVAQRASTCSGLQSCPLPIATAVGRLTHAPPPPPPAQTTPMAQARAMMRSTPSAGNP